MEFVNSVWLDVLFGVVMFYDCYDELGFIVGGFLISRIEVIIKLNKNIIWF